MIARSKPEVKFTATSIGSFAGNAVINAPIKLAFEISRQKSDKSRANFEFIIFGIY